MTVYIIQNPLWRDRSSGQLVAKHDFTPAEEYGRIEFLLDDQAKPWDPSVIAELHRKLEGFGDGDWLLLTGNPILGACAAAIVADRTDGVLRFLKWDGKQGRYTPVSIDV